MGITAVSSLPGCCDFERAGEEMKKFRRGDRVKVKTDGQTGTIVRAMDAYDQTYYVRLDIGRGGTYDAARLEPDATLRRPVA